jgi:hypothetical protein
MPGLLGDWSWLARPMDRDSSAAPGMVAVIESLHSTAGRIAPPSLIPHCFVPRAADCPPGLTAHPRSPLIKPLWINYSLFTRPGICWTHPAVCSQGTVNAPARRQGSRRELPGSGQPTEGHLLCDADGPERGLHAVGAVELLERTEARINGWPGAHRSTTWARPPASPARRLNPLPAPPNQERYRSSPRPCPLGER